MPDKNKNREKDIKPHSLLEKAIFLKEFHSN